MFRGGSPASGFAYLTGGTITGTNVPYVVGSSGAAINSTNTASEEVLATVNLPVLTTNAMIRIQGRVSCTNNANAKTVRVRISGIGGTAFFTLTYTSTAGGGFWGHILNRGATNSQFCEVPSGSFHGLGTGAAGVTGAVDTSVATTLVITSTKATGTDTLTLEDYIVELCNR